MIEIRNVTFHYSGLDQAGLCDFNLSVTDGECILLCGASGCGKTTVTRLINGLIPHFFKMKKFAIYGYHIFKLKKGKSSE